MPLVGPRPNTAIKAIIRKTVRPHAVVTLGRIVVIA